VEEYLHDMKEIAEYMKKLATIMNRLMAALDKLFIDVETKKKGEQHGSDITNNRAG